MTDTTASPRLDTAPTPPTEPTPPSRSRWWVVGALLLLVLALPLARFMGSYNYVLQLATVVFMWIALSSSWNILGGYTGYISLGHNVFFGIGGYVAGLFLMELGWS
ncbi:MAG TPA: branched-chain amino acid ABC transporter ATP-binding protein, partial [Acidimicrobiia bacterium]|nr:branched-chain amino acid ABC transporter ATP-binding protein [Acidimicrobiia bacterium]